MEGTEGSLFQQEGFEGWKREGLTETLGWGSDFSSDLKLESGRSISCSPVEVLAICRLELTFLRQMPLIFAICFASVCSQWISGFMGGPWAILFFLKYSQVKSFDNEALFSSYLVAFVESNSWCWLLTKYTSQVKSGPEANCDKLNIL